MMTFKEYQELSGRTDQLERPYDVRLSNYTMGLIGESGEIIDLLKKYVHHNHPLNKEELKKELGDNMWYLTRFIALLNLSLGHFANTDDINAFQQSRTTVEKKEETNSINDYSFHIASIIGDISYFVGHYYKSEINEKAYFEGGVAHFLKKLLYVYSNFATVVNLSLEDICQSNINKLKERYPEGFSSEKSLNRTI